MATLDVILGAGFSYDAGLPLAWDLTKMFTDNYSGRLFRRGSSEWHWKKTNNPDAPHLVIPNPDGATLEYLFNEIIKDYKSTDRSKENYEDFYNFIQSKDDNWIKVMAGRAVVVYKNSLIVEPNPKDWVLTKLKDSQHLSYVIDIFGWLIADALYIKYSKAELSQIYKPFINHLYLFDKVNIHTLNHDRIIETIIEDGDISDGFGKEGSTIANPDADNEPFPIFLNKFDRRINLYKLHGSVDLLRYDDLTNATGHLMYTGEYRYFKTLDDYAKHMPVRLHPDTKEILQQVPIHIDPQFITGRNKPDVINNDYMYSQLFKDFEENMSKSTDVLIIGYGYGDEHVNDIIKKASKDVNIVNVNPGSTFSYPHFTNVQNYKYMVDALLPKK